MIFAFVKPAAIQSWIAANAAGSLKQEPGDSWRAYLIANGGTGGTINDLEQSFLSASAGGSPYDKWQTYLTANGGGTGKSRDKYQTKYH
jgi:phage terminase large subunit-like protein